MCYGLAMPSWASYKTSFNLSLLIKTSIDSGDVYTIANIHAYSYVHTLDLIILFFLFQEEKYKLSLKGARAMKHKAGTKNWTGEVIVRETRSL